ncbi:putative disease resistance RPP13-like protein 1 [Bienertia sinuspersici]
MAGLVLSPLLDLLIDKLIISKAETAIDLYFLNVKQKKELPETIKRWKEKLVEMEAVLSDAEQQQIRNKSIQKWLNDLQDWAYDLEDVLDEFATNARLRELNGDLQEADPSLPTSIGCSPFTKVSNPYLHFHKPKALLLKLVTLLID